MVGTRYAHEEDTMNTKTWHVDVFISEKDGRTHAEAVLLIVALLNRRDRPLATVDV